MTAKNDPERRYWDSDAFIGWLGAEQDKVEECRVVIRAAQERRIILVTSALTLAEVIKVKKKPRLPQEQAEQIRAFFMHEWIAVRQVTRAVAEQARELFWYSGINPKDAVHVATALSAGVTRLETFDTGLTKRSGKIGSPALAIGRPIPPPPPPVVVTDLSGQLTLDDDEADDDDADDPEAEAAP